MDTEASLGQTIREERHAARLTGSDIRRLAGIHPTCLSFFELDKREPTLRQLRLLARAIGIDALKVFGRPALEDRERTEGSVRGARASSARQQAQRGRHRDSRPSHTRSLASSGRGGQGS